MWAALARIESGRITHSIACYDPADTDQAPARPTWITEVCDSALTTEPDGRARHELLTQAGRNIVFCTHTGAVIALDSATGKKAWAFRYPRPARKAIDLGRIPDPAPAIAFGGQVFVAPTDTDRIYALDAETGRPQWESVAMDGVALLGVTHGRVIVTVNGQMRGVRALSVANGSQREPDGWVQHDGGGLATFGRGFANDDVIVWPTKSGIIFLRPDDGYPLRDPLRATTTGLMGNVAYADGCFVVVTATHLLVYLSGL
jgi:outer membrane protein assembly factor BamB